MKNILQVCLLSTFLYGVQSFGQTAAGPGGSFNTPGTTSGTVSFPVTVAGAPGSTIPGVTVPDIIVPAILGYNTQITNISIFGAQHSFAADLDLRLMSPGGTVYTFNTDNGGSTGLDTASDMIFSSTAADCADAWTRSTAAAQPANGLQFETTENICGPFQYTFNFVCRAGTGEIVGDTVNGDWNLRVTDDAGGDTGSFSNFSITFASITPPTMDSGGLSTDALFPPACALAPPPLSASSNAGTEADGTVITLTATAPQAVSGDQTVDVAVTGTGITATDFALSNTSITIADGQTTGTATLTVSDDSLSEGAENLTVMLSNPSSGLTLDTTTSQTIAITDNDAAALSLNLGTGSVNEGGGLTAMVSRNTQDVSSALSVGLTNSNIAEATIPTTVTIAANASSATFMITGIDDDTVDGNQSITVDASSGGFAASGATSLTVVDTNVDAGPVTISDQNTQGGLFNNVVVTDEGIIDGGFVTGTIESSGTIQNVLLQPNTDINGGTITGTIRGTSGTPGAFARINAAIDGNASLQNVVIGSTATVDANATIGADVRFESLENLPANLDLTNAVSGIIWDERPLRSINLGNSLQTPSSTALTLLRSIQLLDQLEPAGFAVAQDTTNGELSIRNGELNARILPVTVRQAPANAPQTASFNEDGDISIVTVTQQEVIAFPLVTDETQLRLSAGSITLEFDDRANIVGTVSNGGSIRAVARPTVGSVTAATGSTPGASSIPHPELMNVNVVLFVFEDDNGQMLQQQIVPVPADWLALKATLQSISGVENTRISTEGIISITINGVEVRALADYQVRSNNTAGAQSNDAAIRFLLTGDLNGDGIGDIEMVYPNGDRQYAFGLPPAL